MAEKTGTLTGFCGMGQHEGSKPRSPSGLPMKTCMRVYHYREKTWHCGCKCHVELDRMFQMMDMERYVEENPEYVPVKPTWQMPTLDERVALSIERRTTPTIRIESVMPTHVPATVSRVFTPTVSGRAGRGQLELWVKQACDRWIVDKPESSCTPQWISDQIVVVEDIKPPSVGAINAVFERWTKLNFALVGRKPVRFVGYTDEGVKHGLDGLKIRAKLQRSSSGNR